MNASEEKRIKNSEAANRIVTVASDLFYKQGYRATGINEVIRKSGVAKATFYHHFPTKDDLCVSCLKVLKDGELIFLDNFIAAARDKGAIAYFLSVIESIRPWAHDTDFRGCGFLNMAAEIPDSKSPLRKEGTRLYDEIRRRVEVLCEELVASDKKRYGHLDRKGLSNDYMLAFAGAVMYAELYHDIWPVDHALTTMRRLIGETK